MSTYRDRRIHRDATAPPAEAVGPNSTVSSPVTSRPRRFDGEARDLSGRLLGTTGRDLDVELPPRPPSRYSKDPNRKPGSWGDLGPR